MISDAQIQQAVETGICPLCQHVMIPGNKNNVSICSNNNHCGLGVLPPCQTYKPAKKFFSKKRRLKAVSHFQRFEKIAGKRLYAHQGHSWKITRDISIKAANDLVVKAEIQRAMFSEQDQPTQPSLVLPENQRIGLTNKSRLVIFERVD